LNDFRTGAAPARYFPNLSTGQNPGFESPSHGIIETADPVGLVDCPKTVVSAQSREIALGTKHQLRVLGSCGDPLIALSVKLAPRIKYALDPSQPSPIHVAEGRLGIHQIVDIRLAS
jgi:hypothetical protein